MKKSSRSIIQNIGREYPLNNSKNILPNFYIKKLKRILFAQKLKFFLRFFTIKGSIVMS